MTKSDFTLFPHQRTLSVVIVDDNEHSEVITVEVESASEASKILDGYIVGDKFVVKREDLIHGTVYGHMVYLLEPKYILASVSIQAEDASEEG